jgi:NADH-ubiquinone oxidoreductase chain 3
MTSTTFFIIFIPILSVILLAVNLLLAPHNPYQEKDSTFECGFHSFLGQNRTQFSVSFFIFGLLFLLFDLEILLVYPFSVSSYTNDIYGLGIMLLFFILLTLGFIFELGKGALNLDSKQTSSSASDASPTLDLFITLHSSILQGTLTNLFKAIFKHFLAKLHRLFSNKITYYLQIIFSILFEKYPFLYRVADTFFIYIKKVNLFLTNIIVSLDRKLKNEYPIFYSFSIYIINEILYLVTGNLNISGLFILTFYLLYKFSLYNLSLYCLLLINIIVIKYLQDNEWFRLNYPRIQKILITISTTINICIIGIFLNSIYIELILPLGKKIYGYIVKMSTPSGNFNNDPSGGKDPKGDFNSGEDPKGDFNRGGEPNSIGNKTTKKSRSKKSKNKTEKTVSYNEIDTEEIRLNKAYNKYVDFENEHNKKYEIEKTLSTFLNNYSKWLPNTAKLEIDEIRTTPETNESQHKGYDAPNILTYWKLIKQDNTMIHSRYNKIFSVFEVNSKRIQNQNLGGTSSDKSQVYRNDLNELKEVYRNIYREKDNFLKDQINKSNKIDFILKQNNTSVKDLFDRHVIG